VKSYLAIGLRKLSTRKLDLETQSKILEMMDKIGWVTVEEGSKRVTIEVSTILHWILREQISYFIFGKKILVEMRELSLVETTD
jgi:hypothetical protein